MNKTDTQMKLDQLHERFYKQIGDAEDEIKQLIGKNRNALGLILFENIDECFTAMKVARRAIFEYAREANINQALKTTERS